jgi:hypothetical protein
VPTRAGRVPRLAARSPGSTSTAAMS